MIISPHALTIRKTIALTKDQAQWFLDGEVFFAGLGMTLHVRCIPCVLAREFPDCAADLSPDARTLTVQCRCRNRRYDQGDLTPPTLPRPMVTRQAAPDGQKHRTPFTRDEMAQITAYERLLHVLDLEGGLLCLRCHETVRRNRDDDGTFNLECSCTTRTYPLSAVAATSH